MFVFIFNDLKSSNFLVIAVVSYCKILSCLLSKEAFLT